MTTPSGGDDRARPGSIADPYDDIADPYDDLLATLDDGRRWGLVHRLSVGYYEGWRPSREEVANIVARETGQISESEYLAGARSPVIAPDPRPRGDPQRSTALSNGSAPSVGQGQARPAKPTLPAGGDCRRVPVIERALPRPDVQEFTVDCGELLPGFRFVVSGLSRGDWVLRAEHRCRLIALDYELGRLRVDIRAGQADWHTVRGGRDVAGLGKDASSAATAPSQ